MAATLATVPLPKRDLGVLDAPGVFILPWYRWFQQISLAAGQIPDPAVIAEIEAQIALLETQVAEATALAEEALAAAEAAAAGVTPLSILGIAALDPSIAVGLAITGPLFTVSQSPVTSYGTLTATLNPQAPNLVFAGPASGAPAAPTFRALVLASADFANQGTVHQVLHGNAAGAPSWAAVDLTADVTGVLPFGNGGTSHAGPYTNGQLLIGDTGTGGLDVATLTAGANITITNAPGSITIAATGGGGASWVPLVVGDYLPAAPLPTEVSGLTLSAAGSTGTFGIAAGRTCDATMAQIMLLASAFTKTTAAWASGTGNGALDTGSIANSTWYHVFIIAKAAGANVDILISTNLTPTLPVGYVFRRRIGSMLTDGSAHWAAFTQVGGMFSWATPVLDANNVSISTSRITHAVTVPPIAGISAVVDAIWVTGAASGLLAIDGPLQPNLTTSGPPYTSIGGPVAGQVSTAIFSFPMDGSQTLQAIANTAGNYYLQTQGWNDPFSLDLVPNTYISQRPDFVTDGAGGLVFVGYGP